MNWKHYAITFAIGLIVGFFIAANNQGEAAQGKVIGNKFLNALRLMCTKIKGLFSKK